MSNSNKLDVVPTRMTQMILKNKMVAASRGYDLLKRKADALMIKFRSILKDIEERKESMGNYLREASLSLSSAKFLAGDNLNHMVIEGVDVASYKVKLSTENIVGVSLPVFEPFVQGTQVKEYTGLAQGGQKIKACRETFYKALEALVDLASLQTTFLTLDQIIKITNRRVNALEHVVKPRLKNTIDYVDIELEELEREETFRLKKIQKNKELAKKKLLREEERRLALEGHKKAEPKKQHTVVQEEDDDIIF